jgi:hypothetical protein
LYFIDSCIFTVKEGEYVPPTGQFLGELTNEISTSKEPDAYITKFASCGAKNYAYEVFYPNSLNKEYFCKVKGLSLNFSTSNIVNFESMKVLIDNAMEFQKNPEIEPMVLDVPQKTFNVTPFLDLKSKEILKKYRFVYDKRRIIPETYCTLPFGYKSSGASMPSA